MHRFTKPGWKHGNGIATMQAVEQLYWKGPALCRRLWTRDLLRSFSPKGFCDPTKTVTFQFSI